MSVKKILTSLVLAALLVIALCFSMVTAYAAEDSNGGESSAAAEESSAAEEDSDPSSALEEGKVQPSSGTGGLVKVSVSDVSVSTGEEVTVNLSLTGKSIVSFEGTLEYDTEAFSVVNIAGTDILSERGMAMFEQDETTDAFKSGLFVYASPIGEDLDGTVVEFTFKAIGTEGGKYDFELKDLLVYEDTGEAPVMCETEITSHGSITVNGAFGAFNPLILVAILVVVLIIVVVVIILVRRKKKETWRPAAYVPQDAPQDEDE